MRTVKESALIIAELLNRNNSDLAIVGSNTIRNLSGNKILDSEFLQLLKYILSEKYSWKLVELDDSKYCAIRYDIMENAENAFARANFTEEELSSILKDDISFINYVEN